MKSPARTALAWVAVLALLRAALPLVTIEPAWEFQRDELLYFAMGDHLDPFRMQFPPLIAVVAAAGSAIFGDAIWAARVPAALAGALVFAGILLLARRLGGTTAALALAAAGAVAAPVLLRPSVLLQPVVFDQLFALMAVAGVALAAEEAEPRWWLLAGLGLGLGALTKFSAAFYAVALAVPVLAVPALRRQLGTRWPWLAAGGAALLALPSVTGQIAHGWPFLAQLETLRARQLDRIGPAEFLLEQPMLLGATLIPVAAGFLAMRRSAAARVAGLFAVALLGLMIALKGKGYYAAPGYPPLIAVGSVALGRAGRAGRWTLGAGLLAATAVVLPMGIPVLGPAATARYAVRLGVTQATRSNQGEVLPLPQDYADMLGWRRMAEVTAAVWHGLTPAERADGVVIGANYGEAGALARYHARFGMPYPASVASDFHAWGLGGRTGAVTVVLARPGDRAELARLYQNVEEAARIEEPRAVPEERDLRVFVARGPKRPLADLWPTLGPRWG